MGNGRKETKDGRKEDRCTIHVATHDTATATPHTHTRHTHDQSPLASLSPMKPTEMEGLRELRALKDSLSSQVTHRRGRWVVVDGLHTHIQSATSLMVATQNQASKLLCEPSEKTIRYRVTSNTLQVGNKPDMFYSYSSVKDDVCVTWSDSLATISAPLSLAPLPRATPSCLEKEPTLYGQHLIMFIGSAITLRRRISEPQTLRFPAGQHPPPAFRAPEREGGQPNHRSRAYGRCHYQQCSVV